MIVSPFSVPALRIYVQAVLHVGNSKITLLLDSSGVSESRHSHGPAKSLDERSGLFIFPITQHTCIFINGKSATLTDFSIQCCSYGFFFGSVERRYMEVSPSGEPRA
jgi:hypothetical protein